MLLRRYDETATRRSFSGPTRAVVSTPSSPFTRRSADPRLEERVVGSMLLNTIWEKYGVSDPVG